MTEVRKSIEDYGCSSQRYRQLAEVLARRDSLLVGDALLSVWLDLADPDLDYQAQRFVGRLLLELNPVSPLTLDQILATLANWNLSVEEFPWYLAQQFGKEAVLERIEVLDQVLRCDAAFLRATKTACYWLGADRAGDSPGRASPRDSPESL